MSNKKKERTPIAGVIVKLLERECLSFDGMSANVSMMLLRQMEEINKSMDKHAHQVLEHLRMGTHVTYPYHEYHDYRVIVLELARHTQILLQEYHYLSTQDYTVGFPLYPRQVPYLGLDREYLDLFPQ